MRRTRTRTTLITAPAAALALLTLSACGGSSEPADGGPAGSPSKPATAAASIKIADSPFGRILVDDSGRTLYGFAKDKPGAGSACDTDCIAVWPALTSAKDVTAGSGTDASLLKEIKLAEGAEQATYGDWPLYYYVGDATPGDVNGQGLDGEWFVIGADGKLIKKAP
ncbi:COG4315 family predicted lipoprotein [Streptomyces sp. NPDC001514]